MNEMLEQLKHYFKNTPRSIVEEEWSDLGEAYGDIGPKLDEFFPTATHSTGISNKDVKKLKTHF